jgi:hypothetical protein
MRRHAVADRGSVVAWGLALVLSACGGAATASEDASVDELGELVLVEDLRIGSLDDPRLGFSQIRAIEVGDDGSMYVLEGQDREVRIYAPDGTLVRRFGGRGSGPGEFQNPFGLTLAGDTVAVAEVGGNGRLTLFDRDGNLGRTIQVPAVDVPTEVETVRLRIQPFRMRSDGRFEGTVVTMSMASAAGADRPDSIMAPRILFDREGRPVDTLGWYAMSMGRTARVGTTSVSVSPMLPDADLSSEAEGDSIVVHRPAATAAGHAVFTVTRVREGGDTIYHRALRYAPIAVTPAYRDSVIESRLDTYRNRPQPPDIGAIRRILETELEWPAFHPPVRSVRRGKDGEVWLLREAMGEGTRWTVLAADGTPRGHLTLPPTMSAYQSDGTHVWGVERDAFEVPWLVRYRMEGG